MKGRPSVQFLHLIFSLSLLTAPKSPRHKVQQAEYYLNKLTYFLFSKSLPGSNRTHNPGSAQIF